MNDDLKRTLGSYAEAHDVQAEPKATGIPGLSVIRSLGPCGIMSLLYKPLLCIVAQGAKQVSAGGETFEFAEGQSLIVSLDLPVIGRIVRASRGEPYLAIALELDMAMLRDLAGVMDEEMEQDAPAPRAIAVRESEQAVVDCALRLVRLLEKPPVSPVLSDLAVRELHYWLLAGPKGVGLRQIAMPDGRAARIARAVRHLRGSYDEPMAVEHLASLAGMSLSSFHQHFRSVTGLTPLQYQKQLRLTEARRLMLADGVTAMNAAYRVGYESPTQFSREYSRFFGNPPRRDVAGMRQAAE